MPMGLCKYQMLSPELLHHFPFVLLFLSPDVFQIFLTANTGTPETEDCHCFCLIYVVVQKLYGRVT